MKGQVKARSRHDENTEENNMHILLGERNAL